MTTLGTHQKAPVLDGNGTHLDLDAGYAISVTPENNSILTWTHVEGALYAVGVTPGEASFSVTRPGDGAVATLNVTVEAPPFSIQLGTPEPK